MPDAIAGSRYYPARGELQSDTTCYLQTLIQMVISLYFIFLRQHLGSELHSTCRPEDVFHSPRASRAGSQNGFLSYVTIVFIFLNLLFWSFLFDVVSVLLRHGIKTMDHFSIQNPTNCNDKNPRTCTNCNEYLQLH